MEKHLKIQEENKENENNNNSPKLIETKQVIHIGPLPPPETLKQYEEIDPSFPNRIFRMAEKEQKFRHTSYYLGQLFALIALLSGLLSAVYLGINGKEWLGGSIGLSTLATIVGAYFYSQKQKKKI